MRAAAEVELPSANLPAHGEAYWGRFVFAASLGRRARAAILSQAIFTLIASINHLTSGGPPPRLQLFRLDQEEER